MTRFNHVSNWAKCEDLLFIVQSLIEDMIEERNRDRDENEPLESVRDYIRTARRDLARSE